MEIPTEIILAIGAALTGAITAIWVYFKGVISNLENKVDELSHQVSELTKANAILETEKRLSQSHGSDEKKMRFLEEAKEYERQKIIAEYLKSQNQNTDHYDVN